MAKQTEKLQKINEALASWGESAPSSEVKFSGDGLDNALLKMNEYYERREYENKVVIWCKIADTFLLFEGGEMDHHKSLDRLFLLMNSPAIRKECELYSKKYHLWEEPTPFMIRLYEEYQEWYTHYYDRWRWS